MTRGELARADRPRLAPGVRLRWDGREGRYLLLSPERGLRLNESAAHVLALCDGARTVDELVAALAGRFPSEPAGRVEADALALLGDLAARGLVRTGAPR